MEYKGIFVIVTTPFKADRSLDEDGLKKTLAFCMEAGVHGVVANAIASEVGYLGEDERRRAAEIVVTETRGRCPAIVGVSAAHPVLAARYASHAEAIGADAVMAMPPTYHPATREEILGTYRVIADATGLPLVLQNAWGFGMTPMSPELILEIAAKVPAVRYVKEETQYPAQTLGAIVRGGKDRILGVMGGRAGKTLMEEVRHGACGTMPACEFADIHVALWSAIEAQDMDRAYDIFRRLLPLLDFEMSYGMPLCKRVLQARGVIDHATWRQTGFRPLDRDAEAELATLFDAVGNLVHPSYQPKF